MPPGWESGWRRLNAELTQAAWHWARIHEPPTASRRRCCCGGALEDAQDYGRIMMVYNGRCDQVMEMLSRELDRGQITAALYRSVERALRWEGRR